MREQIKNIFFYTFLLLFYILNFNLSFAESQEILTGILITSHHQGQEVNQFREKLTFQSDVSVENVEAPVVFIRDPVNQWWPWLQVNSISADRKHWQLDNITFGNENDHNQNFKIKILLFSKFDIDKGIQISDGKIVYIQGGTAIKNSIFRQIEGNQQVKSNEIDLIRK